MFRIPNWLVRRRSLIVALILLTVSIFSYYYEYEYALFDLGRLETSYPSAALVAHVVSSVTSKPRAVLFPNKPLVIWTISNHPAPAADIQQLLEPLGVRFKIFTFNYCERFGQCATRYKLKLISTQWQLFTLFFDLPQRFYHVYKDDPEMQAVDAFLCYDPPAICELYPQFNKSVIFLATNRYSLARESVERWTAWNNLLRRWASDPKNFIGANGIYDANYIRYYTGIDAKVIPSYCDYTNASYRPLEMSYLIANNGLKSFVRMVQREFQKASKSINGNATLSTIGSLYHNNYWYSDLAVHLGIVHIPYQVSTMSIFEQYRMAIPLFFPTKRLLLEWNSEHFIMYLRTWRGWATRDASDIPADPSQTHIPTPNDNYNATAMKYWLELCDWYQWPHITYYDSVLELAKLLNTLTVGDLLTISEKMKRYSATVREEILDQWTQVLLNVAKYSDNHPH